MCVKVMVATTSFNDDDDAILAVEYSCFCGDIYYILLTQRTGYVRIHHRTLKQCKYCGPAVIILPPPAGWTEFRRGRERE